MPERNRYRILDIGVGYGGSYIGQMSSPDRPMILMDKSLQAARRVNRNYRDTLTLNGDGKDLPFKNGSFSAIFIYFPFGSLLQPGLQGGGWYSEYARVLKPGGKLIIYGDDHLKVKEVLTSSKPLFSSKECRPRPVNEFELEEIGTDTAQEILLSCPKNPQTKIFSTVYKIVLEKK